MTAGQPIVELDAPYSAPGAEPVAWDVARRTLDDAEVYWLSTIRPDARPHVTPVAAVWLDSALYFSTGPDERKARNLERNTLCVLTTGCNRFDEGLDVIVEGDAKPVEDEAVLGRLADLFETKYKGVFGFTVRDHAFAHEEGTAKVFGVAPVKAFSYLRGEVGSATRYRFGDGSTGAA